MIINMFVGLPALTIAAIVFAPVAWWEAPEDSAQHQNTEETD